MHFNVQNLSGVSEQSSYTPQFLGKKCKIDFFEEEGFVCSFYQIEMQVVTNWSSRLERTPIA